MLLESTKQVIHFGEFRAKVRDYARTDSGDTWIGILINFFFGLSKYYDYSEERFESIRKALDSFMDSSDRERYKELKEHIEERRAKRNSKSSATQQS